MSDRYDSREVSSNKFIQITSCCDAYGNTCLYALSEDGTVYFYDYQDIVWRRMTTQRIG